MKLISKVLLFSCLSIVSVNVIAQEMNWAKTIELVGNSTRSSVRVHKSVVDKDNNVFLFGDYDAAVNFNPSATSQIKNDVAYQNIFLVKYNQSGEFLWVKTWGSRDYWSYATGFAIDNDENLALVLNTNESIDVDPDSTVNNTVNISNKNTDVLLKLNKNGEYLWHKKIMETGRSSKIREMAFDRNNDLYITGFAYNNTSLFPEIQSPIAVQIPSGTKVTYLLKVENNGSLAWAQKMFSDNEIEGHGLAFSRNGVELVGTFKGNAQLNPNDTTVITTTHPSAASAFTLTFGTDGRYLNQSIHANDVLGKNVSINKMAFDEFGNKYLAGDFTGKFKLKDASDSSHSLGTIATVPQAFLIKYDSMNNVKWVRTMVSEGASQVLNLLVDRDNNPIITGTSSGDLYINPMVDSTVIHNSTKTSGFVVKYNEEGDLMLHVGQTGETGNNLFNGSAVDNFNNIIVANFSTSDMVYNSYPDFTPKSKQSPAAQGSRVSFFSVESCKASDFNLIEEHGAIYATIQQGEFTWYDMNANIVIEGANSYAILPTESGTFRARLKDEGGCIYYSDIITYNKPTNIKDLSGARYAIYPNPVVDVLHLESKTEIQQVQIFDLSGRLVLQQHYQAKDIMIDLANVQSGLYSMVIMDNNGQKAVEKLVKL